MKTTMKITVMALVIVAFSLQAKAQTCTSTLASKTGKVYSVNPGQYSTTASSDQVIVKIRKTAGKAETQVNVFVNGQMQSNPMEFDNGKYIPPGWKTRTLNNVRGKVIRVQIVNQSATNTFSYESRIIGESSNLTTTGRKETGTLFGQTNKTIYTNASCTSRTTIFIGRKSGKARCNIRVWERIGSSWVLNNNYNQTFEQRQSNKTFVVNSNKRLKIELRNVSVGNKIKYRMYGLVAD